MKLHYALFLSGLMSATLCNNDQFTTTGLIFALGDPSQGCAQSSELIKTALSQAAIPVAINSLLIPLYTDSLNLNLWDYYEVSSDFDLLVPKNYVKKVLINKTTPLTINDVDLALGLKISTLKKLSDQIFLKKIENSKKMLQAINKKQRSYPDISKLFAQLWTQKENPLFLTHPAQALERLPKLFIIMLGHGLPYREQKGFGVVSGITTPTLKQFLNFLSHKTATQFVLLESCYTGGLNLQQLFNNIDKKAFFLDIAYNFYLFASTITSAPQQTFFEFDNRYDFNSFFSAITQPAPIDFANALNTIYSFKEDVVSGIALNTAANYLVVKPPHKDWIEVVDLPEKIVSIGTILSKTRTKFINHENKDISPLDISRYFAGRRSGVDSIYPEALLLYAQEIPFQLIFTKNPYDSSAQPPAIISMLTQSNVFHIFNDINAQEFTVSEIIKAFFQVEKLQENKLFLIRTLTARNDISALGEQGAPITLSNVALFSTGGVTKQGHAKTEQELFFTYANKAWHSNNKNKELLQTITIDPNPQKTIHRISNFMEQFKPQERGILSKNFIENLHKAVTQKHATIVVDALAQALNNIAS